MKQLFSGHFGQIGPPQARNIPLRQEGKGGKNLPWEKNYLAAGRFFTQVLRFTDTLRDAVPEPRLRAP
eukprot:9672147-Karenia_brevis.AAC.1